MYFFMTEWKCDLPELNGSFCQTEKKKVCESGTQQFVD